MRARALELIVCPRCSGRLELARTDRSEGPEVLEGELACGGCAARYPVRGGVPRLTPTRAPAEGEETAERFGLNWDHFDRLQGHYEDQFLGWISPNEPADFAGRVVLEGGCGKGRHSALVATWGAKDVVAIDLGPAVDVAFRNCRHLENVHVVQADLLHLPVARRSVDIAFSVGVLHHTEAPAVAFEELAARVRPGGKVIAWVYGRENNGWIVHGVDPIRRTVTSRLPFEAVTRLSSVPAGILWLLSRGVYRPLSSGLLEPLGRRLFYSQYMNQLADFPYWELHCIVADHLVPPIAHYVPHEEFVGWFDRAQLAHVTVTWHNQNSWRGTGIVPHDDRP